MRTAHIHSHGFGLVEVMVAMVIALLGTIVIFQVFAASEDIKRTSTSGGDAQQFGALALFTLERDVRMAGYGINYSALLGCSVRAYDELATPPELPNFTLAPVQMTTGADDKTPDQITVMYGDSDLIAAPPKIAQNMPSPAATFKVNNRYGFVEGDLVLAVEAGLDCTLAQATELPGAGKSDEVIHNSGDYTDANGVEVSARWNKPSGLGVSYSTNGWLYNLGAGPTRNTYRVCQTDGTPECPLGTKNQLLMDSTFATTTTLALADNIVHLKVQYGKDDGVNNGTVTNTTYVAGDGAVDSSQHHARHAERQRLGTCPHHAHGSGGAQRASGKTQGRGRRLRRHHSRADLVGRNAGPVDGCELEVLPLPCLRDHRTDA
jgi:type IV pilus assembly protein PilW